MPGRDGHDASVHFSNFVLLRRRVFMFDDAGNVVFAVANDPAIARWIGEFNGENREFTDGCYIS